MVHDLAQEGLLQAFLSLAQLREPARFRGWLYGITLNICRDFLKTQSRQPFSLDSLAGGIHIADQMPSLETLAEQLELRQTIQNAVQSLSEANRAVIKLFYYEGFSTPEIAELLDISVVAVKVRLHKARQQLKNYLEVVLPIVHYPKGATGMIPVIVADIPTVEGTNPNGTSYLMHQVVLFAEQSRRALVIWIGSAEATAIALGLTQEKVLAHARPMTQQLIVNLLKASGTHIEAIEIAKLENNIYYAIIKVKAVDGIIREIDARPSDALAIAVWNQVPIFVSQALMEELGAIVPEGKTAHRRGIETILKTLVPFPSNELKKEQSSERLSSIQSTKPDETSLKRNVKESAEKIIELAFE